MDYQKVANWQKKPELKRLRDLAQKPKGLYYRGKWDPKIFERAVAIVGSRRMTEYGKRVLEKLIPKLVFEKKTVISGFMYGVDQYAHNLTVDNGGKTIAVLGWGIKQPLATSDWPLANKIIEGGGLLISEWEDLVATRWTFPVRDQLMAGLAQAVYVIEAAEKSGSLITANWAVKLKRELWAVPGPITSRVSLGTNKLIAAGLAKMWMGENRSPMTDDRSQNPLMKILENEGLTADEVARKIGKPVAEVGAQLSLLTLAGEVEERGGKYYVG